MKGGSNTGYYNEDIKIALLAHALTKEKKDALKTIILELERKKHKAA